MRARLPHSLPLCPHTHVVHNLALLSGGHALGQAQLGSIVDRLAHGQRADQDLILWGQACAHVAKRVGEAEPWLRQSPTLVGRTMSQHSGCAQASFRPAPPHLGDVRRAPKAQLAAVPVDADLAAQFGALVEAPRQAVQHRGLAAARGAHDRQHVGRLHKAVNALRACTFARAHSVVHIKPRGCTRVGSMGIMRSVQEQQTTGDESNPLRSRRQLPSSQREPARAFRIWRSLPLVSLTVTVSPCHDSSAGAAPLAPAWRA